MTSPEHRTIADFYEFLWPDADSNADRFLALDEVVPTTEDDPMLAVPRGWGLGADSQLLDIGCGKGKQACAFAADLGCHVVAIDPIERNLDMARQRVAERQLEERVEIRRGTMEAIPLADAAVDFVWCRDMLNHLADLAGGLREAARVLRPGGGMLVCSALATAPLEGAEVEEVLRGMAIEPPTLSRPTVEAAYRAVGLEIVESGSTCEIDSPFFEGFGGKEARDYLRMATLVRAPARCAELIGADACAHLRRYYLWNIYLMIGKISYHVWVLRKPPADPSE